MPVLPILVGSASRVHRHGPLALAAGLVASFVAVGMLITSVGAAVGLDGASVRTGAAVPMLIMGLILLSSCMQGRFSLAMAPVASAADRFAQQRFLSGLKGQFAVGSPGRYRADVALACGAQSLLARKRSRLLSAGAMAKAGMGLVLVLVGLTVMTGVDKQVETLLLQVMAPGWIDLITRI